MNHKILPYNISYNIPYNIPYNILLNSLFDFPTMYSALPFFPLYLLLLLTQLLSLFASSYTIPVSPFLLASPFIAAPLRVPASPFNFPMYSALAHRALCILCSLSVPEIATVLTMLYGNQCSHA